MKRIIVIAMMTLSLSIYGQDKYNYVRFNELVEVKGTEYVIASIENKSKSLVVNDLYLLFINTITGETNKVDFPKDGYLNRIEQVKNDSMGVNKIIVSARAVDLDGKSGIEWNEPMQLFVLSVDGKEKTQLTEDKFFLRTWTYNKSSCKIVVTGHYDTNDNGKYDKKDKNEILIYDVVTLKLEKRI